METDPEPHEGFGDVVGEGGPERLRRFAREAEDIARARASVAAGRLVDSAAVKAWIDSIGTDHELPVPYSGR